MLKEGTVVKFDDGRGYGFIRPDNADGDVFVHFSDILTDVEDGWRTLAPKQRVEFLIENKRGRKCAVDVKVIQ